MFEQSHKNKFVTKGNKSSRGVKKEKKPEEMTADECYEMLTEKNVMNMTRDENRWTREVAKTLLILVYGERENHGWVYFKDKFKDDGACHFLQAMK
jgi:hypothetical protein